MSEELKAALKKYSWVLVLLAGFSGGSYLTMVTFAASWMEMNLRPIDVVIAADVAPINQDEINILQDDLDEIQRVICIYHPEECK